MPETGADEGKAGVPEVIPANSFDSVLDRAVRDASATPDVDIPGITKRMGGIAREEAATMDRARGSVVRDISSDQDLVGQKFQNIESLNVKPWDADQQREKYTSSPLEKFGSLGSVFAIMASAFTHQPMINALNGSAAAMNAMRDREDKNYDSAYQAWKDNTQLAIQRHNIQHQEFSDAITLMNTNMAAGQAKLTMLAARFGDQKTAALVEGGYIKELVELQTSRANAARGLIQMMPQLEKMDQERRILAIDQDWQSGDPKRMNMARQRVQSGQFSPEQDAYSTFVQQWRDQHDGQEPPAESKSKFIQQLKRYGVGALDIDIFQRWRDDFKTQKGRDPSPEEESDFWRQMRHSGGVGSPDKQAREGLVKKAMIQYEEVSGEPPTVTEQTQIRDTIMASGQGAAMKMAQMDAAIEKIREARKKGPVSAQDRLKIMQETFASPMNAYQTAKLEEKRDMVAGVVNQIDRAQQIIKDSGGDVVGIPGMAGRIKEFVFGDTSDKAEFEQIIRTLQNEVPMILRGSSKVLSADKQRIDAIVPGLGSLRNTRQVYDNLDTLKKILQKKDLVHPDDTEPDRPLWLKDYPDAKWQNGEWRVIRDGRTYRVDP